MPSVSASVFRDGDVLWERALGHANVDAEQEATPQTQYRIGSITKTFTAVGIMQLRDAGELSLDDPLTAHPCERSRTLGKTPRARTGRRSAACSRTRRAFSASRPARSGRR